MAAKTAVVSFQCPQCRRWLREPSGTEVRCPGCRETVTVPPPTLPAIRLRCPACTKLVEVEGNRAGQTTRCPECGEAVRVPDRSARPEITPEAGEGPSLLTLIVGSITLLLVGTVGWVMATEMGADGLRLALGVSVLVLWVLVPAYLGSSLGGRRSIGSGVGFLLGLLLGWLGVLIVLLYPNQGRTRKCPYCAERIRAEARVCKHCSRDLIPS